MRLRDMQRIVRNELPAIRSISFELVPAPPTNAVMGFRISNWREGIRALERISAVPSLAADAALALNSGWGLLGGDPGHLAQAEGNALSGAVSKLIARASILDEVISSAMPEQDPLTVSVKLPTVTSFDELKEIVGALHVAIAHPTSLLFGPCVEIQNFDTGSNWIEFFVSAKKLIDSPVVHKGVEAAGPLLLARAALKLPRWSRRSRVQFVEAKTSTRSREANLANNQGRRGCRGSGFESRDRGP